MFERNRSDLFLFFWSFFSFERDFSHQLRDLVPHILQNYVGTVHKVKQQHERSIDDDICSSAYSENACDTGRELWI